MIPLITADCLKRPTSFLLYAIQEPQSVYYWKWFTFSSGWIGTKLQTTTLYIQKCAKLYLYFQVQAWCPYLFNVQEVFGFEGYGHALHRNVIAGAGVVTNICPHSKRHRFGLNQWWRGLPVSKHNRDYHSIKAVEETTVDPWPLPSQAWRGPVCQPPSSEPPGPPPRTRLSPMAGWCRSLRSPEMHKEFT